MYIYKAYTSGLRIISKYDPNFDFINRNGHDFGLKTNIAYGQFGGWLSHGGTYFVDVAAN